MPSQCCVGGCSKETVKDGVSHHYFPSDTSLRARWVKSISNSRKHFTGPGSKNSLVVCSDHFKEDFFTQTYRSKKALGLDVRKYTPKLEKDAIPTLFNVVEPEDGVSDVHPTRSAVRKREVARILKDYVDHRPAENPPPPDHAEVLPSSPVEYDHHDSECDRSGTIDQLMSIPYIPQVIPPTIRPVAPKLPKPAKTYIRSKYVQATTATRTFGTQFLQKHMVRMVSKGSQYNSDDLVKPAPPTIRYPTNYKQQLDTEQAPKISASTPTSTPRKQWVLPDPVSPVSHTTTVSHDTSFDTVLEKDNDMSMYAPSECTTEDREGDSFTTVKSPIDMNKLVVFEDDLLMLFTICRRCQLCTTAKVTQRMGTFVSVLQECSCGYEYRWSSQPFVGDIPTGNLLLSASILFSGSQPTKVLRLLSHMNIQCYSVNTFFTHQRHFLLPAVESVWNSSAGLLCQFAKERGGDVRLAGDGRSDSPGHSAKYGSYTVMDLEAGKVLDIKLVQSNEVKGSTNMEKEGLRRVACALADEHLNIKMLVTDRHVQIQKWVRENLPNTQHCYDVWHIAKAVKKKLMAIAKTKDCEDVGNWVKSISNHLYWCAASSQDGDMILSKWQSVSNHVQNVHSGHRGKFSTCQHDDIGSRKWLQPSSKAACAVEDYVTGTRLCKDMRKLSTQYQTSDLEAYHSVVNHFAPKLYSFDYNAQLGRMKLAALHFNENTERPDAVTKKTGILKTQVSFPKFKKGEYTIKVLKENPTYKYVDTLLDDVLAKGHEKIDNTQLLKTPVPPPLCSTMKRPTTTDIQNTLKKMPTRYKKRSLFV